MTERGMTYHIPALAKETIEALNIQPDGTYIDVTFGGGGHSRLIMEQLSENGRLFGFDQDADAYGNRIQDKRFQFVHGNFRYVRQFLHYYGVTQIDGLVADLGVSFHHFDTADRGFSFRFDGPLDMRMNQSGGMTAADIVNHYEEKQLETIFRLYGELQNARNMAHAIVTSRAEKPILRTEELAQIAEKHCRRDTEKKELAKVFQALRIETNNEMGALHDMLNAAKTLLKPQGRIAILTYHSLEDRMVKNFFRSGNIEGIIEKDFYGNTLTPFRIVSNKPITASEEEVTNNPRARSAKLRIAEKRQ